MRVTVQNQVGVVPAGPSAVEVLVPGFQGPAGEEGGPGGGGSAGLTIFTNVAAMAAVEGTIDGEAAIVIDSTGIQSQPATIVTAIPGGFTGAANLWVLLEWDVPGDQWLFRTSGAANGGVSPLAIGTTPPSDPLKTLWWNSNDGRLYIRYDDGDSIQWVDAAPPLAALSGVVVENNLTSTSTINALSANQGRVLKGLIDNLLPTPGVPDNGKVIKVVGGAYALATDDVGSGSAARALGNFTPANPNFRYLRFYKLRTLSSIFWFNLSELQLRDASDAILSVTWSTNISLTGGSVTTLSNSNMSDGIVAAISDLEPGASKWIQADLGAPTTVVGLRGACTTDVARQLKTFDLEGSNDGTTFTPIAADLELPTLIGLSVLQASTWLFADVARPVFGASSAGELGFHSPTGKFYGCQVSGNPGTWSLLN